MLIAYEVTIIGGAFKGVKGITFDSPPFTKSSICVFSKREEYLVDLRYVDYGEIVAMESNNGDMNE